MTRQSIRLSTKEPFDLNSTVYSHGWVMLEPWRWDGKALKRQEKIGTALGSLKIYQSHNREIVAQWHGDARVCKSDISHRVKRLLSVDWPSERFRRIAKKLDPLLAEYVDYGGGRFLRGTNFYEDFVKTVCTINTTWGQTIRMVNSLVENARGTFPSPLEVICFGKGLLKNECRLGFRVDTIWDATERMLSDGVMAEDGNCIEELLTYDYLISLRGIGPYAAAHCRMLLHDYSRLPVDSEVSAYLASKNVPPEAYNTHYSAWGEYAFLGYKLRRIIDKKNWIGDDDSKVLTKASAPSMPIVKTAQTPIKFQKQKHQ